MLNIFLLLVLSTSLSFSSASVYPNYHPHFDFATWNKDNSIDGYKTVLKWWQTATFYQIYPRSFKDSDGDGVGDLKGITQNLQYLKDIGVTATWLSPIFTSPMADFGYDIANFTEIDKLFGTMSDLDKLIDTAKGVGIKIILDFVPNHSSDECEWFKRSAAGDAEYKDFYVWHPGKIINGVRQPPNNWVSVFRGSAWSWHEQRGEYYLHQFVKKQPDLNYRNPKVRQTMNEVLRFWLRRGVAGFRVDAVPHVFEDKNLPDEPRNDWVNDPDDYGYLNHIYTVNQPETLDLLYEWRRVLDEFKIQNGGDERVLLAETYSPIDVVMQYYGNETSEGAQIPFNFFIIGEITNQSNAYDYSNTINNWLQKMPKGRTANWVIGNHDKSRVGSRLGEDRIDMMNMLVNILPGCSITYNGEEIGMTNVWISWNDTVDPSACNSNPNIYENFTRDPERTPFQWSDGKNAGFSTADKTWLPISPNYKQVNVRTESDFTKTTSHLHIYKHLKRLRTETTLMFGSTEVKALSAGVLAIKRTLMSDYTFVALMNIGDDTELLDLNKFFDNLPVYFDPVIVMGGTTIDPIVHPAAVLLQPKQAMVLKSPYTLSTTAGYYAYYVPK